MQVWNGNKDLMRDSKHSNFPIIYLTKVVETLRGDWDCDDAHTHNTLEDFLHSLNKVLPRLHFFVHDLLPQFDIEGVLLYGSLYVCIYFVLCHSHLFRF